MRLSNLYKPGHLKICKLTFVHSEHSDQPSHPCSLAEVLAGYPICIQGQNLLHADSNDFAERIYHFFILMILGEKYFRSIVFICFSSLRI